MAPGIARAEYTEPVSPPGEHCRLRARHERWLLWIFVPLTLVEPLSRELGWLAAIVITLVPGAVAGTLIGRRLQRSRKHVLGWLRACGPDDLPELCDALLLNGVVQSAAIDRLRGLAEQIREGDVTGLSEERAEALFGVMRWPDKKLCGELIRLSVETADPAALPALADLAWIAEPGSELKAAARDAYARLAHAEKGRAPSRMLLRPASEADAAQLTLLRPGGSAGEDRELLLRPADAAGLEQKVNGD